jgi:hypothetical protein
VAILLELSDEEARELRIALDEHLHGLRTEFASTEARRFRARLLETMDLLESVAARLGGTGANATTATT